MNLRARTIRLAHANPVLRPHLLPLLKTAAPDPAMLERLLDGLLTEDEGVNQILETYESHFRTAGTEIDALHATLQKAKAAVEKAEAVVKAIAALVAVDPENKDHEALQKKAEKALATLVKTQDRARKDYHTTITKVLPTDLKKAADKAEKEFKSKLLDPTKTWRGIGYGLGYDRKSTLYFVDIVILADRSENDWNDNKVVRPWKVGVRLTETVGIPGVLAAVMTDGHPDGSNMKPEAAVEAALQKLKTWPGLKGGADAAAARKALLGPIGGALFAAARRLGDVHDNAKLEGDRIHVMYRSGLPKEGDRGIDEYRYEEMVSREMARARKAVDDAMAPFKGKFDRVTIHPEEKGYISLDVWLN